MELLLNILSNEVFLGLLASVIAGVLLYLRKARKNDAFEDGVDFASKALNEIAPLTKNTWDDKLAFFVSKVNEKMHDDHGFKPTPKDEEKAKALFEKIYPPSDAPTKETGEGK